MEGNEDKVEGVKEQFELANLRDGKEYEKYEDEKDIENIENLEKWVFTSKVCSG